MARLFSALSVAYLGSWNKHLLLLELLSGKFQELSKGGNECWLITILTIGNQVQKMNLIQLFSVFCFRG